MILLLKKALKHYPIRRDSLKIEKELHKTSWNKDLHFKISKDGSFYSARFIGVNRSPNTAFGEMNDNILKEQIHFCSYLIDNDIPFMRLIETANHQPYCLIKWEEETYRFILHKWIEGIHIHSFTPSLAKEIGRMSRHIHDISSSFESAVFTKTSHLVGYRSFMKLLMKAVVSRVLKEYLNLAEFHMNRAAFSHLDYLIQTDLNPMNILWTGQQVKGIVDFESIGYGDRMEGLAWLIKWYSRTDSGHSRQNAKAFLTGYGAGDFLDESTYERLSSLIWLSGCMNWKFVQDTINLAESGDESLLKQHLDFYIERGKVLQKLL